MCDQLLSCYLLFSFAIPSKLKFFKCIIMAVGEKIKSHPHVEDYFKKFNLLIIKFPFYNKQIKKPRVKRLKNIYLLSDLPFYEELNVMKTNAFRGYAM